MSSIPSDSALSTARNHGDFRTVGQEHGRDGHRSLRQQGRPHTIMYALTRFETSDATLTNSKLAH